MSDEPEKLEIDISKYNFTELLHFAETVSEANMRLMNVFENVERLLVWIYGTWQFKMLSPEEMERFTRYLATMNGEMADIIALVKAIPQPIADSPLADLGEQLKDVEAIKQAMLDNEIWVEKPHPDQS